MSAQSVTPWPDDEPPLPAPTRAAGARPWRVIGHGEVPNGVWRGSELASQVSETLSSGWPELDAELPGGGWPRRSLTEILTSQPAVMEWRLIGRALGSVVAAGGEIVLIGPPRLPHLPGLAHEGLDQKRLILIQAQAPAERLWVTEQMIKSNAAGAVVAWLPQARQEQIRRLQVCAQACDALVFLCRPEAARHESSAAPLRVHASYGLDWELNVDLFKRRGPVHATPLALPSVPGGLAAILTPRLRHPSRLFPLPEPVNAAVGSVAPRHRPAEHLAVH